MGQIKNIKLHIVTDIKVLQNKYQQNGDNKRLVDDISSIESGDDLLKGGAEALGMEVEEEVSNDDEHHKKKKKKEKKKHKTKKGKKKKEKKNKHKDKDQKVTATESDVLSVLID